MKLICLTTHYNPCGYKSLRENYTKFYDNLGDVPILVAELSFDNNFFIPHAVQIKGDESNLMWQKERLLNILLEKVPSEYDAVAWVDADILFEDTEWYLNTKKALKKHKVVQMFSEIELLGPNLSPGKKWKGSVYANQNRLKSKKKPGYAWAARIESLPGGFMDRDNCGGADISMIHGWLGNWWANYTTNLNPEWRRYWLYRAVSYYRATGGNIGYVDQKIKHLYHGTHENRKYKERLNLLIENNYDPENDICIDDRSGLLKWNTNKKQMIDGIVNYFHQRKDDD